MYGENHFHFDEKKKIRENPQISNLQHRRQQGGHRRRQHSTKFTCQKDNFGKPTHSLIRGVLIQS